MDAEDWVRLVAAALAGDEGATTRLVAELTPVIQARVARTLLSCGWGGGGRDIRSQVEDLTQEVLLELFANDGRVLRRWQAERGLSLKNFVGLVAERRTYDFIRDSQNLRNEEPTDPDDLDGGGDGSDALQDVIARQQLRLLLDRLRERLSPLGWHLFVLLFVQELSVQEVMAATELSADAVYQWRSRLRRLARKLRNELSKSGSSPRRPEEDDEDNDDDENDENDEDDDE